MLSHLRLYKDHILSRPTVDPNQWAQALKDCAIMAILPSIPPSTIPPALYGLNIMDGFACPLCATCGTTYKSIRSHFSVHHNNQPNPAKFSSCSLQFFNKATTRTLFQVLVAIPPELEQSPEDMELERMGTLGKIAIHQTTNLQDPRASTTWLQRTKWHDYTRPYNSTALRQTVASAITDYPLLPMAIQTYMQHAVELIKETDELTLQILNTEDLSKYAECLQLYYLNNSSFLFVGQLIIHLSINIKCQQLY